MGMEKDSNLLVLPTDDPPSSGVWIDVEDVLANATEGEIALGELLGASTPDYDYIELPDGVRLLLEDEDTPSFRRAIAGYELALAEAKKLKASVEKYGVKCTIELMIGRPWSGDDWYSKKYVLMNHHTAGSMSGLTPTYSLCRRGRTDVSGPLCNAYGGRDFVFRIVCMGLANHPGAGGPLTIDGVTLPKDSARISSFGIEWEHSGVNPWPAGMKEFMGKAGAGVLDYLGRKTINSIEHKTWAPTRKIDRNPDFSQDGRTGQNLITQYRGKTPAPPQEDDDMTPEEYIKLMEEAGLRSTARGRALSTAIRNIFYTSKDRWMTRVVWKVDGVVEAPASASTREKNPYWAAGSHLPMITNHVRYLTPKILGEMMGQIAGLSGLVKALIEKGTGLSKEEVDAAIQQAMQGKIEVVVKYIGPDEADEVRALESSAGAVGPELDEDVLEAEVIEEPRQD